MTGSRWPQVVRSDTTVRIGDLSTIATGEKAVLSEHTDDIGATGFSPDGFYLVSGGYKSSLENPEWGHGALTTGVLAGLKGEADLNSDDTVHLIELYFFVEAVGGGQTTETHYETIALNPYKKISVPRLVPAPVDGPYHLAAIIVSDFDLILAKAQASRRRHRPG